MSWLVSLVAAAFKGLSSTVLKWWTARQAEKVRLKLQRMTIEVEQMKEKGERDKKIREAERKHYNQMVDPDYDPLDDV